MFRALKNRRRLRLARREVAGYAPDDPEQQRLRRLVLAMMDAMQVLHCRPGMARAFDQAWEGVQHFRRCLDSPPQTSPEMTAKGDPP